MRTATCAVFLILAFLAVQHADAKKIGGVRMKTQLNLNIPQLDTLGGVAALKKAARLHPGYRPPASHEEHRRAFEAASKEAESRSAAAVGSDVDGSGSEEEEDPFDDRNYYNPACARNSTHGFGLQRLFEVCEKVDFDFMEKQFVSSTAADKAWTKFCETKCIGSVAGFFQNAYNPECANDEGLENIRVILGYCQKDAATDEYCGAQILSSEAFRSHPCERSNVRRNATHCATQSGCYWDYDEGKCEEIITERKVNAFCGNCMRQMVGVNEDLSRYFDTACTKVDSHFCAIEFQNYHRRFSNKNKTRSSSSSSGGSGSGNGGGDNDDGVTTEQINHLCLANQSYRHTCVAATMGAMTEIMEASAEDSFDYCWSLVQVAQRQAAYAYAAYLRNSDSRVQAYYLDRYHSNLASANRTETQCLQNYERTVKEAVTMGHMIANLCQKNGDTYCYTYTSREFQKSDSRFACTGDLENGCSTDCNTAVTSLMTELGCCANALQTPKVQITAADFLPIVVNGSKLGRVRSGGIDLSQMNACEGARAPLAAGLAASCSGNGSATSEYSIVMNINQTIFGANASWVAMLTPAALTDIGIATGLDRESVLGFSVTANDQGSYTAKFRFQGPLQVITDLIKSNFDARLASRGIRTRHVDRLIASTCRRFCRTAADTITATTGLQSLSPVTPDPCQSEAYFTQLGSAYEACAGVSDLVFETEFNDITTANASWNIACSSPCNAALKVLKANRFGICLSPEARFFTDTMSVGCTQDSLNLNRCGAVLSTIGSVHCPSLRNSTACASAPGQCQWVADYNQCVEAPSAAYAGSICDGGCVGRLAAALAASNNKQIAKAISLFDQYFCSKDNGTLCLPLINTESTIIDTEGVTNSVLVSVCETPQKRRCFKRTWSAVAEASLRGAEDDFLECAEYVYENNIGRTLSSACHPSHPHYRFVGDTKSCLTIDKCLAKLAEDLVESEKFDAMVSYMCVKNPKGNYCINAADPYISSTDSEIKYCIGNPLKGASGSSRCSADFSSRNCTRAYENFVADLGCCTGTAHFIYAHSCAFTGDSDLVPDATGFAKDEFGEDDLSDYSGSSFSFDSSSSSSSSSASASSTSSLASSSGLTEAQLEVLQAAAIAALNSSYAINPYIKTCGGLFDLFEFCPSKFPLNTMLTAQYGCVKPKVTGANRTLTLGVAWNTISGSAKQKNRLLRKLKGDLSAKFGLAKDEFGAFELVEDAARSITVSSTGRHMAIQNTGSGSKLNFQVATSSAEDNAATATEFDNVVASGNMTLPSTAKAVSSECSNCTSAGSASSIQTSIDTTGTVETGGDSSTSGASLATVAVAFLVAIMTILL